MRRLVLVLVLVWPMVSGADDMVREAQELLQFLGYDVGQADGQYGPQTREAIKKYQKDRNLSDDGALNKWLITSLRIRKIDRESEQQAEATLGRTRAEIQALPTDEVPAFLEKLDPEARKSAAFLLGDRLGELPTSIVLFILGAQTDTDILHADTNLALDLLRYTPNEDGIRQFQRDINAPITGELTWKQSRELQRRARYARRQHYSYFSRDEPVIGEGYVVVDGTWIIEGQKVARPVNAAEITCLREQATCFSATSSIEANPVEPDRTATDNSYLDTVIYPIISWSSSEIIARMRYPCSTTRLTIDLVGNETYKVTTRRTEGGDCRTYGEAKKPRIDRLISSRDHHRKFWKTREKEIMKLYNSDYQKWYAPLAEKVK